MLGKWALVTAEPPLRGERETRHPTTKCLQMGYSTVGVKGFPGGSVVKSPPANAGDVGSIPGSGRSPGEGNGNHSSILAWEIPRMEEPGGLQSMGLQKSWTRLNDWACTRVGVKQMAGYLLSGHTS